MEKDDMYMEQLEEIFKTCSSQSSRINKSQLLKLCEKLSLNSQCTNRLQHLAFPAACKNSSALSFVEFCDCFVAALSEINDNGSLKHSFSDDIFKEDLESTPIKVKPRLVKGGKSYGRRSAPFDYLKEENVIDNSEKKPEVHQVKSDDKYKDISFQVKATESFYYEPLSSHDESDKGEYFEAIGVSEVTSKLAHCDLKFQKHQSTSTNNESFLDASSVLGTDEVDLFSYLRDDVKEEINVEQVLESWSQAGVLNPRLLLEAPDIQICVNNELVDTILLSRALQNQVLPCIASAQTTNQDSMLFALLSSFKYYSIYAHSELTHHYRQVEKMKDDLERSEIRHSKILEEVDDRYLSLDQQHEREIQSLERKWDRKLIAAKRKFDKERESMLGQMTSEREELLKEIDDLRSKEKISIKKVEVLTAENNSLSEDITRLLRRLTESEKESNILRKDLEYLLDAKVADFNDPVNTSQEEKFALIIKDYEAQCRNLSDHIDELRSEIKLLRSQLRRQDFKASHNNMDLSREKKIYDVDGKNSDVSLDDDQHSEDEDLTNFGSRGDPQYIGSNIDQALANNFTAIRMMELEKLVESLRKEKRKSSEKFAVEKENLKKDLQEEYRSKLEASCNYGDNRAIEEQQNMMKKLLEEATLEKDEFETKYKEIKASMERATSGSEQEMADLCRQFAKEKEEIIAKYDEKISLMEESCSSANQNLDEEKRANERLTNQLRFEREQHKEALSAHQEIINKFEKSASARDNEIGAETIKEIREKHQEELAQLKRDHACALEAVKLEMEKQLETLLEEKRIQDNSSMCSELERLQETVGAERQVMHDRLQTMREDFEREAVELRNLLERDKAKLRTKLNEEVMTLKQKIAEEGENELKKRRKALEAKHKEEVEMVDVSRLKEQEISCFQSQLGDYQTRVARLEASLSDAFTRIKDYEEKEKAEEVTRQNEAVLRIRIEDISKELFEQNLVNKTLQCQLNDAMKEKNHVSSSTSTLRIRCDERETECEKLRLKNSSLTEKVAQAEADLQRVSIENSGLTARCRQIEKQSSSNCEQQYKNKIKEMEEELSHLRSKLDQLPEQLFIDQDTDEASGSDALIMMRKRLAVSRNELAEHLKRTKDLYVKLSKAERLVKDLYCENAHLMRALQVTEVRQRDAEKRCTQEQEKNCALNQLVRRICDEVAT